MSPKSKNNILEGLSYIGCIPMGASLLFIGYCLLNAKSIYNRIIDGDVKVLSLLFCAILFIVLYCCLLGFNSLREKHENEIKKERDESAKFKKEVESKFERKEIDLLASYKQKESKLQLRESIVKEFVSSLEKEKYCAQLIADFKTVLYDQEARRLKYNRFAAPRAAETVKRLRDETRQHIEALKLYQYKEQERIAEIRNNAQNEIKKANDQVLRMRSVAHVAEEKLKSTRPFSDCAELYADAMAVAYGIIAEDLRQRIRPANTTANVIERELKSKIKETMYEAKLLKYRLDFLLQSFPELNDYIFDDSSLISMSEYNNLTDFNEHRDMAHDYLSDEEYNELSTTEKYQLALDRYKERNKPNSWIAGVEYEMYCAYLLRKNGYSVIDYGVQMKKADLGRDIIAHKDGTTYIIQCKRYSLRNRDGTDKYVHENVICQLYGTAIEYQLTNPNNSLFSSINKITPVLYTTGQLSEMAKAFANRLDVVVKIIPMGDYPMIKCNINNNDKIYHLPFDQQYWQTKIDKPGEFYAWTVQEAEKSGFRRALRHVFSQ